LARSREAQAKIYRGCHTARYTAHDLPICWVASHYPAELAKDRLSFDEWFLEMRRA
jgi:hypothetical protein